MTNFKIFKYANPAKFLHLCEKTFIYLVLLTIIFLSFGLYQGFFNSPEDYQQGNLVRIMYVHVPSAWMALMIYSSIAIASCIYLINKHLLANIFCKSASLIGASFTLIAIVTGSIWGKPTWGTWWAWDARITSMLILALFYGMYLLAWRIYEDKEQAIKVTSLIAILGVVNVPIIKFSVDWWNTLHQPASINILSTNIAIHPSMLAPLGIMTAAFALFSLLIFLMKYNTELIKVKNKGLDRL